MNTLVTDGIKISVIHRYEEDYSDPDKHNFVFFYRITIENTNGYKVKLLRRHWEIFDSNGVRTMVDGEGVVGEKPELEPGELYSYESHSGGNPGVPVIRSIYSQLRNNFNFCDICYCNGPYG